jgi:hypothetical protein
MTDLPIPRHEPTIPSDACWYLQRLPMIKIEDFLLTHFEPIEDEL